MSKARILSKNSVKSIIIERHIIAQLHHPFIVNMIYAFQDFNNLYQVTELLTGGDLRYHILRKVKFNEEQVKFI